MSRNNKESSGSFPENQEPNEIREKEINSILLCITEAMQQAKLMFEKLKESTKTKEELVLTADKLLNEFIVKRLRADFPESEYGILSEELADDKTSRQSQKKLLVIDPLDGSERFFEGNGDFAINIALIEKNRPTMGAIALPAQERIVYAVTGKGAFVKDNQGIQPIKVTGHTLPEAHATYSKSSLESNIFKQAKEKIKCASWDREGSAGFKLAQIAQGNRDFYFRMGKGCYDWDIAAGDVIAGEAGGKITDMAGNELKYNQDDLRKNNFLASNGITHEEILTNINDIPQ